jgi:hypothetical protein
MKIAIDVGGVLTEYGRNDESEKKIINAEGALDVLQEWKSQGHELYIVSFCREKAAFFRSNKFIDDGHSHLFNYEYYVEEKMYKKDVIYHIKADIMIDDNQALLYNIKLKNKNTKTILFQEFNKQRQRSDRNNLIANNWMEVRDLVNTIVPNENVGKSEDEEESFLFETYEIKQISEKAIFIA